MTLVTNWRGVLARAWSIRLILLAGLLTGGEAILTFVVDMAPSPWLAAANGLTIGAAFVARLVAQKDVSS